MSADIKVSKSQLAKIIQSGGFLARTLDNLAKKVLFGGVPVGFASSAVGSEICAITARIKKYNSIIEKKCKRHDKILLLAKAKLDTIEVLISKALIDLYINHGEFVSVNNV